VDAAKALAEVRELLGSEGKASSRALDAVLELLKNIDGETLLQDQRGIRAVLDEFPRKRRQQLTEFLDIRIKGALELREGAKPKAVPPPTTPALKPELILEEERKRIDHFIRRSRLELRKLSEHHLYKWSTYYRDTVGQLFESSFDLTASPGSRQPVEEAVREAFAAHSKEIFTKGFEFNTRQFQTRPRDAILKCVNGLQRFLELPVEVYGALAENVESAEEATRLHSLVSAYVSGIVLGFADVSFGSERGSQYLPAYPRSWAHYLAFVDDKALARILSGLAEGPLSAGLREVVLPILRAIDRFLRLQQRTAACLPRLGHFDWEARRLDISLALPKTAKQKPYLELACFTDSSRIGRQELLGAASGVSLVAASLRGELKKYVESNDLLKTTLVITGNDGVDASEHALEILKYELAKYAGGDAGHGAITLNLPKLFPLNKPHLNTFYRVRRRSVSHLLKLCENETGVRLWCSVRRSGKTTGCLYNLESTGAAQVVLQTCESTAGREEEQVFFELFTKALEAERQLPRDFLEKAVIACGARTGDGDAKVIFVLDEYETLFGRMKAALKRNHELRYTIIQPLLNQFVAFARGNLVIFVGQVPDAHYIIMDQNQLSSYVQQDVFPLFEHDSASMKTEFVEFLRKVLTERVQFDQTFVNAVFTETAAHPFLTVNVLVEMFDWLISQKRGAHELRLTRDDFDRFVAERLSPGEIKRRTEFNLFSNFISEALSDESRKAPEGPWLFVVYSVIQRMARRGERDLGCSLNAYYDIAASLRLADQYGIDPDRLLISAQRTNFLLQKDGRVVPTIRVLARLTGVAIPKVTL
jgi:hypothetical protein